MILNLNGNGFSHLAVRCTGIHRQAVNCLFIMKAVLSFSKIMTKSLGFVLSFSTPGLYQGVQAVVKNSNVITKKQKKKTQPKKKARK